MPVCLDILHGETAKLLEEFLVAFVHLLHIIVTGIIADPSLYL